MDRDKLISVISTVPFYSQKIELYRPSVSWENIPIIDKEIVRENLSFFLNKNVPSKIEYCRTSGSTGTILNIYWDNKDYLYSLTQLWRFRKQYQVYPQDLYGTNHAYIYDEYGTPLSPPMVVRKNSTSFSKIDLSFSKLETYAHIIEKQKLIWLFLQPTFAYQLGIVCKEIGITFPHLKLIELTGEMLDETVRKAIEDNFGVPVINHYGMQEFNAIAYEDKSRRLRCVDKNVFVEVLNSDGSICQNGEEGNIVVSTLTNTYMPLIRYKTMDRGFLIEEEGNRYLTITNARSRSLLLNNGHSYDSSVFFLLTERLNTYGYGIYQFQYRLKNNYLYCHLISKTSFDNSALEKLINDILSKSFNICFDKIVVDQDSSSISHPIGEKLQYFIHCDA